MSIMFKTNKISRFHIQNYLKDAFVCNIFLLPTHPNSKYLPVWGKFYYEKGQKTAGSQGRKMSFLYLCLDVLSMRSCSKVQTALLTPYQPKYSLTAQ